MQPPNIHGTRWPGCSSQAPVVTKFQPSIFGLQLFKGRQSKIDLEASSILYLVPCCGSLHICTNMGLRGSEPTKTLASLVCLSLGDTWQNQACKCSRAPSLASVTGATGLSCSQRWRHCCMLTVHLHFWGIIHSLWIFETIKNNIYWLLSFISRQQGHIVGVREESGLCPPPPAPHSQVPHGDLSYSREPRIRGTVAYFCQEVFAELRLTYWGKQQTLLDHINKPSFWASM